MSREQELLLEELAAFRARVEATTPPPLSVAKAWTMTDWMESLFPVRSLSPCALFRSVSLCLVGAHSMTFSFYVCSALLLGLGVIFADGRSLKFVFQVCFALQPCVHVVSSLRRSMTIMFPVYSALLLGVSVS